MPPRGRSPRKPPSPDPQPRARPVSASPDRSSQAAESDNDDQTTTADPLDLPPFYNTTFSAHRVSPLHIGKEPLTSARLQKLADWLRGMLVGDVVRGVEVGRGLGDRDNNEDGSGGFMGRAGALELVEIRWVPVASVLDIGRNNAGDDQRPESRDLGSQEEPQERGGNWSTSAGWQKTVMGLRKKKALYISLRYEAAECTALLLPSLARGGDDDDEVMMEDQALFELGKGGRNGGKAADPQHFLALPLLLLRMPAPLKAVVSEFLAKSFDCRVSTLRMGTRSLVRSWETWIRSAGLPSRGPLAKDMVLGLGFYLPPSEAKDASASQDKEENDDAPVDHPLGLKSIDFIIPAAELRRFVDAGSNLVGENKRKKKADGPVLGWDGDIKKRRKLAGRLYEEGWEWRKISDEDPVDEKHQQPFTEALGRYVHQHLALDLFHPGVRITKIACGGFVMSEGRVKVFAAIDLGDATSGAEGSGPGQRAAVWELLRDLVGKAKVNGVH
ncbi:kinetochore complex Sim4 subunit Fta1-domain-containing protein [Podospora didyma]|uniref:Kinetochore complex Sim4 subunit Fta1-domain-containing protein n=1 Tax=Podospora didyma TaxID=330526 RepID=A0AAE0NXW1_9PEZI|nr:kinetochore complex Sim4 subunit Fta1-domain-containing protein [Podospora didyma]